MHFAHRYACRTPPWCCKLTTLLARALLVGLLSSPLSPAIAHADNNPVITASPLDHPVQLTSSQPASFETSAAAVPPRPGCPDGMLAVNSGNQRRILARPLQNAAPGPDDYLEPGWTGDDEADLSPDTDNQMTRLANGDLLALYASKTLAPISPQPEWWNNWHDQTHAGQSRDGRRSAIVLWRSACGGSRASWSGPLVLDAGKVGATDPAGTVRTGYCALNVPGTAAFDRPELVADPWGVDPHDPTKQRIYVSTRCERVNDDGQPNSTDPKDTAHKNADDTMRVFASDDTGHTWHPATIRLSGGQVSIGQVSMATTSNGRLFMLTCVGYEPRIYWSDDHAKSLSTKPDGWDLRTLSGAQSCGYPPTEEVGVFQPNAVPTSLAPFGDDAVLASYPVTEPVPIWPFSSWRREVQQVVLIRPHGVGQPPTVTVIGDSVVRPQSGFGSILQASLVADDRPSAADRSAMLYWMETSAHPPPDPHTPGQFTPVDIPMRARYSLILPDGTITAPQLLSDPGGWVWPKEYSTSCPYGKPNEPCFYGDFMKGGFYTSQGKYNFVAAWPELTKTVAQVYARIITLEPNPGALRYNAVWTKSTPYRPAVFGWTLGDLQKERDELLTQGYQLETLNGDVLADGTARYNATWVASPTYRPAVWGWTSADLQAHAVALGAQGYQVESVNAYVLPDGTARYNAIWVPSVEYRPAQFGWTSDDLQARAAQLTGEGYQVKSLTAFVVPDGTIRYNAIWMKSAVYRPAVWGWTIDDLAQKRQQLLAQGYQLEHVSGVALPDGTARYNAIWTLSSTYRPAAYGWTLEDLQKKDGELEVSGYHIASLNALRLSPGQVRYNAIWQQDPSLGPAVWGWSLLDLDNKRQELAKEGYQLLEINAVSVE